VQLVVPISGYTRFHRLQKSPDFAVIARVIHRLRDIDCERSQISLAGQSHVSKGVPVTRRYVFSRTQ
jgi:hypothetical protein